jgi:starch synthase
MYSLKYGTIPIVRAVGGLKDSVDDYNAESQTGTGFVFVPYDSTAMLAAIDRGLAVYRDKTSWHALMRRAMAMDFSWERSARLYSRLYQQLSQ